MPSMCRYLVGKCPIRCFKAGISLIIRDHPSLRFRYALKRLNVRLYSDKLQIQKSPFTPSMSR